jgi:hypothetical protein
MRDMNWNLYRLLKTACFSIWPRISPYVTCRLFPLLSPSTGQNQRENLRYGFPVLQMGYCALWEGRVLEPDLPFLLIAIFLSDRRSKSPIIVQTTIFTLTYKGEARRLSEARQCLLFPISIQTHLDARILADKHAPSANGNLGSNTGSYMVGACRAYGRDEKHIHNYSWKKNLKVKGQLEDLEVYGRIMLT